jgi:hypothetical protein
MTPMRMLVTVAVNAGADGDGFGLDNEVLAGSMMRPVSEALVDGARRTEVNAARKRRASRWTRRICRVSVRRGWSTHVNASRTDEPSRLSRTRSTEGLKEASVLTIAAISPRPLSPPCWKIGHNFSWYLLGGKRTGHLPPDHEREHYRGNDALAIGADLQVESDADPADLYYRAAEG